MLILRNDQCENENLHFLPYFLSIRTNSSHIHLRGKEKAEGLFPLLRLESFVCVRLILHRFFQNVALIVGEYERGERKSDHQADDASDISPN